MLIFPKDRQISNEILSDFLSFQLNECQCCKDWSHLFVDLAPRSLFERLNLEVASHQPFIFQIKLCSHLIFLVCKN